MELHSLHFLAFFAIVFTLYYLFWKKKVVQNVILLVASYVFYAMASIKIVPIILLMTLFFYFMGIEIDKWNNKGDEDKAQGITTFTIIVGLLPLFYFKYFNFFYDSFVDLFNLMGLHFHHSVLKIILPLGLSFYTFRLVSYAIEVNQCSINAEKNMLVFATYVAYFPSLIAGPIDRPNAFIPQLHGNREPKYENFVEGLKRFLWGWFMKICVADRMTAYMTAASIGVDNGTTMFIVALMVPFRIYCDFAGYSHMAIGVSRMLGIVSAENFNRPFFAQNISDYWRRWHMSLTSWVTDYVYTPLSFRFRKRGKWGMILAIYVNLFIISFWHQASWGYVLFGLYHATLFVPIILKNKLAKDLELKWITGWILHPKNIIKSAFVYLLIAFGGIIADANSISDIVTVVKSWFAPWGMPNLNDIYNIIIFIACGVVVILKDYLDECGSKYSILKSNKPIWVVIGLVVFAILIFYLRCDAPQEFVYKQF